jgi:hypothetical protein
LATSEFMDAIHSTCLKRSAKFKQTHSSTNEDRILTVCTTLPGAELPLARRAT